jgi:hypothetical protein
MEAIDRVLFLSCGLLKYTGLLSQGRRERRMVSALCPESVGQLQELFENPCGGAPDIQAFAAKNNARPFIRSPFRVERIRVEQR